MSGGRFFKQLDRFKSEVERIEYENTLVRDPDPSLLVAYLGPLIEDMLDRLKITDASERAAVLEKVAQAIPRAAHLYMTHSLDINSAYPFSVYFSWFAKEVMEGKG